MDLYLCMRKLGNGEAVAYFSFLFGFILSSPELGSEDDLDKDKCVDSGHS